MANVESKSGRDIAPDRSVAQMAARREELAEKAMHMLSERGYARTSLRDIAQSSEYADAVVHFYFDDKSELITYCVRMYKIECIRRYDAILAAASSADELRAGFTTALADTLRDDGPMHRLWYDLRNQGLFEESFHDDVREIDQALELMIWRVVTRYADLSGRPLDVSSSLAYAIFDGLFQQALLQHFFGAADAGSNLTVTAAHVMESLLLRH